MILQEEEVEVYFGKHVVQKFEVGSVEIWWIGFILEEVIEKERQYFFNVIYRYEDVLIGIVEFQALILGCGS